MDPGKKCFSGKVYTRRTKKMSVSPVTTTGITPSETSNVLKSKKVPPQTQNLLIANSASWGVVPDNGGGVGVVDGGDGGVGGSQPSRNDEVAIVISRVEDRVRIRLTRSVPIIGIKNLKSRLEGELDLVRSFVKKVEAKEKLPSLVSVRDCEKISSSPLVWPPSVATIANDNPAIIGGVVERGKRIRKENKCYNNSEFLLAKDKLPYERPYGSSKKSKNNKKEKKPSISPKATGIPVLKKPRAKDLKNKREMTNEEIQKLIEDLENLPSENRPTFVQVAMKRGMEKIDTKTLWELDRFVKKYNKSSKRKAEVAQNAAITCSGSNTHNAEVVAALKASETGEMHTSASFSHADNARSCSSD